MISLAEFIRKVFIRIKGMKALPPVRRFVSHNQRVFTPASNMAKRQPIVLCELNQLRSAHIAYSYLAQVLAEEHQARVVAYVPEGLKGWWQQFKFRVVEAIGSDQLKIYRSFGSTEFLALVPTAVQKVKAKTIFETVAPKIRSNFDIEGLIVEGILIGDLIYDTYLMKYRRATIDRQSQEFQNLLLSSIELFLAWNDYFDNHDVRAINVSHCVYNVAIPLRIAVKRGIPSFQINLTHLYRLTKNNLFAYNDFMYFPEKCAALPPEVREEGLAAAKRRIERRFAGEVGVDMEYSTKSAYGDKRYSQLLRPSSRKKILIATHCFFDSPHSYGNNIFPDFYEWLSFLGEMTQITDYDWYIKIHPDYLPGTKEIIDKLVAQYPKFTLLPADSSHHQIIAEGIDLALTVFGTIAFEYAALGVLVINASQSNPHIAYDFNLHATSVENYRRMLLDLDCLEIQIDEKKVREYYFMRYIYNTEDIFFESYDTAVNELGGYNGQFEVAVYDKWLENWSAKRHSAIVANLRTFVRSGDFRMDYTHYGHELSVKPMIREV